MITVTTPAPDRNLLSLAEIRVAAGLSATDGSQDVKLGMLNGYISALIATACRVASDGIAPPTLRAEVITETVNDFRAPYSNNSNALALARRPVATLTSITEIDTVLTTDQYLLDRAAGLLYRGSSACPGYWVNYPTVVVYTAGYATVPDDLKYAASKFVLAETQRGTRDPLLRSKTIEGVSSSTWWVDPQRDSAVPPEVMDILSRGGYLFGNVGIG